MARGWRGALTVAVFALLLCSLPAAAGRKGTRGVKGPPADEDVKGPVVRHATAPPPPPEGNATSNATDGTKKKSIAQIIDEALEQEFPEEKREKIGKNYNETALQEDVRSPRSCVSVLPGPDVTLDVPAPGLLCAVLHTPGAFLAVGLTKSLPWESATRDTPAVAVRLPSACSSPFTVYSDAVQTSWLVRAQATVETVIKVSGNKHAEDVKAEKAAEKAEAEKEKEEAERQTAATLPPAAPPPPETVVESIIHHSWGHLSADPKDIPVVRDLRTQSPYPLKDARFVFSLLEKLRGAQEYPT